MPHKILIIDDDRINCALIKFTLAGQNYDVAVAHDGDQALKMLDKERPDLLILDVHMPEMNGYEFMTELKQSEDFSNTPVIMVTANQTMEDVFKLEGVKGYFVKPVDLMKMLDLIVEIIGPNPI